MFNLDFQEVGLKKGSKKCTEKSWNRKRYWK